MSLVSAARPMIHAQDPAEVIWDDLREFIDGYQLTGKDVLIVAYERGENDKTQGGLWLPDKTREEDGIQGVTGLVVKLGPLTPEVVDSGRFGPNGLNIGDWVTFDSRWAFTFKAKKRTCRQIQIEYVMGILPSPDLVL